MTYFEKAAKVGNVNAQYMLGKLWLETGTGDPEQAIEWLTKTADGGNAAAQYTLAKFYRDGTHVQKGYSKGSGAVHFISRTEKRVRRLSARQALSLR